MDYIELENEFLKARIKLIGAELVSLFDKNNNREVFWQADKNIWAKSSPILFPVVGNLNNRGYYYTGIFYDMPRHGFASESKFELQEIVSDSVKLGLSANDFTKNIYPFNFALTVIYTLLENKIKIDFLVENNGNESMFFNIGAHPGFKLPFNANGSKSNYVLKFQHRENLLSFQIDSNGLLNGEKALIGHDVDSINVDNELLNGRSLIFSNLNSTYIDLISLDSNEFVRVEFSQFSNLLFWSAKGEDAKFICIEPWEGLPDESGFDGDISQKRGIVKLDPDEIFNRTYSVLIQNSKDPFSQQSYKNQK